MTIRPRLITAGLALSMLLSAATEASAATTFGFDGVNKYEHWMHPDCIYGNRTGAFYVQEMKNALTGPFVHDFMYTDDAAWESDISDGRANRVNFFTFAGHGIAYYKDAGPALGENATLHFYSQNGDPYYHGDTDELSQSVNATWAETRLGHGVNKFASFYSCNWLTNGGRNDIWDKMHRMFEGTHIITGFASVMWLDYREGATYGSHLNNGKSVKNAWFQAAREWQKQSDTDVIVRVTGHANNENDHLYTWGPDPKWYVNDAPGSYRDWTEVVVGTNEKVSF